MASLTIGPEDRNPDYARGEKKVAHIIGDQTAVLSARGGGHIHAIVVGVTGTLAKFYDIAAGVTPAAANQMCTVSLAAVTVGPMILDAAFSKGCTVVVTGGAGTELTVSGQFGATSKSQYHYPVR
jgi:hypothetical protein